MFGPSLAQEYRRVKRAVEPSFVQHTAYPRIKIKSLSSHSCRLQKVISDFTLPEKYNSNKNPTVISTAPFAFSPDGHMRVLNLFPLCESKVCLPSCLRWMKNLTFDLRPIGPSPLAVEAVTHRVYAAEDRSLMANVLSDAGTVSETNKHTHTSIFKERAVRRHTSRRSDLTVQCHTNTMIYDYTIPWYDMV